MKLHKDWFDKSLEFLDEECYCQALVAINLYIKEHPKRSSGKLLKAKICRDLSNYKLALQLLDEIKPTPEDSDQDIKLYCIEMGELHKEMGNTEEALKWFDKAIESVPTDTMGYIFKGACLARGGHYELAKKEFLKATKLEGMPEEAYYNLALISRAELHFEEAKIYCEQSLTIDPNHEVVLDCYEDILKAINLSEQF